MSENPGGRQGQGPGGAPDPFAAWKAMYQTGEQAWSQMFEQMVGTQAFATAMGQALENYLKAQEVGKRNLEQSMSAMNVPTRSDLTRIASQIVAVDAKLDDLAFAVEELSDQVKALAANGPEGVRNDLARLTAAVEALSVQASGVVPVGETARPAGSRSRKTQNQDALSDGQTGE